MHFGSNFHKPRFCYNLSWRCVEVEVGCKTTSGKKTFGLPFEPGTITQKRKSVSDHVLMTTSNGQGMPTKVYEISYLRLCGYDKHTIGSNKCTRSCRHPLGTSLLPVSSSHIAYTPEDNDPCILYRIHFLMISSCCNRRFYIACFFALSAAVCRS